MKIYLLSPPADSFLSHLPSLFQNGVDWFQYRRPGLSDRFRREELRRVVGIAGSYDVPVIVNDRPDLALISEADGVHLGKEDLPAEDVKKTWPELIVGKTVRLGDSISEDLDYLSLGPIFSSPTKTLDRDPCGWEKARQFADRTSIPLFGIGGISHDQLGGIPTALEGIAVVKAVWGQQDPVEALKRIRQSIDQRSKSV